MTTTTYTTSLPVASKKEILQRLLENEHITFDEMWVLLQEEPDTKYIVLPQQNPPVVIPYDPNPYPWQPYYDGKPTITSDDNTFECK